MTTNESLRKAREMRSTISRLKMVLGGQQLVDAIAAVRGKKVATVQKLTRKAIARIEQMGGPAVAVPSRKGGWKVYTIKGYETMVFTMRRQASIRREKRLAETCKKMTEEVVA